MTRDNVADLLLSLSDRDRSILESLQEFRLLTTAHLRRLHFRHQEEPTTTEDGDTEHERKRGHTTEGAAAVAAMRVLGRLEARGLVARPDAPHRRGTSRVLRHRLAARRDRGALPPRGLRRAEAPPLRGALTPVY